MVNDKKNPAHIAIIMDGNGRWAKKQNKLRTAGHSEGAETFKRIVEYCSKIGIKYLTVYAFSTENWKRPNAEVTAIMSILKKYLKEYIPQIEERNMGIHIFGDESRFSSEIKGMMEEAKRRSKRTTGMQVGICLNYGGRSEIVRAAKMAASDVKNGSASIDQIDEDYITSHLYTYEFPDPDLIIRPSGELRISNFLLWQMAYSELFFTEVLWPDFSEADIDLAIASYQNRSRRFGGI